MAVTVDLPTPPLPDATQTTLLTWASAPAGSRLRPSLLLEPGFSSGVRTSKATLTPVTPSSADTACVTACWKWLRIGQPGVVSDTITLTAPRVADLDRADHVQLDDRPAQLGVDDGPQASVTCSVVGILGIES